MSGRIDAEGDKKRDSDYKKSSGERDWVIGTRGIGNTEAQLTYHCKKYGATRFAYVRKGKKGNRGQGIFGTNWGKCLKKVPRRRYDSLSIL